MSYAESPSSTVFLCLKIYWITLKWTGEGLHLQSEFGLDSNIQHFLFQKAAISPLSKHADC